MDAPGPAPRPTSRLTRIVTTPAAVDRLLFFPFSCVMPESTGWEASRLPHWKKEPNTWRVLLVLGNVGHFAGDMPLKFWSEILSLPHWEHIIYVSGPYDYGAGTLELGDYYLTKLQRLDGRLTVFGPACAVISVFFTGPRVLVRGVNLFSAETIHYQDARVYQRELPFIPHPGDEEDAARNDAADKEAIMECRWVTKERAEQRLKADVETLLSVSEKDALAHVIVSYGCPDELASGTRKQSPFYAAVKLGNAQVYKRFADIGAVYWFCGSPADKATHQMYKSKTLICNNCFRPGPRKLPSHATYIVSAAQAPVKVGRPLATDGGGVGGKE